MKKKLGGQRVMYNKEILDKCFDEYLQHPLDDSAIAFLRQHKEKDYFQELLRSALDVALDIIQKTFLKYDIDNIKNSTEVNTYIKMSALIKDQFLSYYVPIAEFFLQNTPQVIFNLKKANKSGFFGNEKNKLTIEEFSNCFVAPFKGGYKGFWEEIYHFIDELFVEQGAKELCHAVSLFYYSDNSFEIRSALEEVIIINPKCVVAKELLALSYYNDQMWGNAVAYFEQLNTPIMFFEDYQYFMMGWCYGKLKEKTNEISAYEKCKEVYGEASYALNYLGYAYYTSKQYNKALACFQECIDHNIDLKYAVNNYAKTLLAMKRFKDAKAFAKNPPVPIHKEILKKINNAESTNKRISADKALEEQIEIKQDNDIQNNIDFGVKKQQFTSEKILEDELMLRMERGLPIFGLNLKLYRRNGIYGRQYILTNKKRLDLLAEDAKGNLYIIELKKDSGYDDAYEQTTEYLNWFDDNWKEPVKNIYGIICLNTPSQELLDKVHGNSRIRVFEYQISYTER
jgi:tetratricopeptide (TPR) repeat protein